MMQCLIKAAVQTKGSSIIVMNQIITFGNIKRVFK